MRHRCVRTHTHTHKHAHTHNKSGHPNLPLRLQSCISSCFLCLMAPFNPPPPPPMCVVVVACMHGASASVWMCVCERPKKLHHACVTLLCIRVCACVCVCACMHACGSWHGSRSIGRLSSHQDVPTGPSLGRVPGLSPACVLAECCQIIPHTWKLAWRWSYPPFTLNLPLSPPPTLPEAPPRLLDRRGQRSAELPAAYPRNALTRAFISCTSCDQR